ncbi:putative pantothenate transporter [Aureobasidium namibiae CBS 147.97]|uniref:Putative pantothenate transporter n=1 Tax=Aureobasidium namibiae CBS 147.97 TaxID=1043004 RepID=A0A074X216_9PEZI|nr:putative pantothenate transporter [Aureobasidium namibiae CBS 147.97]KEQ68636.1 putative pantothenate transporter [Aureobasidium namibiae CBS 147.97]
MTSKEVFSVTTDPRTPSEIDEASDRSSIDARNPFKDPKVAEYYRTLYEEAQYESREAFDPEIEWTAAEEKSLVRRLDWHVCLWACVMFFALQLDRGNISQALSDNMLDDLGLTTNEYNYGQTLFKLSFMAAEVPSQLVSKKLGPDRWIPIQMMLWSIVAAAQAALSGRSSFYLCRCLIGVLEGGFIPDLVLWLSYFYTSTELPVRLSFFWTALNLTTILASLLAFGIFHLDNAHGLEGWRWLFLIEGLMTFAIGVASVFLMPASAVQTKTWFRPKGWFTDREVKIVVNRVLRDDPSKGDMHNRQAITIRRLWQSLTDYDLWPIYALGLVVFIPATPVTNYLSLTLRHLGFSTFNTNLLTIVPNAVTIITLLGITWLSEKVKERSFIACIQNLWMMPCLIALRWWSGSGVNVWGTYALLVVLLGYPYCHAILVAWTSRNAGSVRTRTISAAVYNMSVQAGGVIGSNIYRQDDKPLYHRGNMQLVAVNCLAIALYALAKAYYVFRNKQREKKWGAMTQEQRDDYIQNTTDQGNKRLDFRFAH